MSAYYNGTYRARHFDRCRGKVKNRFCFPYSRHLRHDFHDYVARACYFRDDFDEIMYVAQRTVHIHIGS